MGKQAGFGWLLGWLRRRQAPEGVDPADVGTAFGMELRLDADNRVARATVSGGRPANPNDTEARMTTLPP